jgi:hypothetical protein
MQFVMEIVGGDIYEQRTTVQDRTLTPPHHDTKLEVWWFPEASRRWWHRFGNPGPSLMAVKWGSRDFAEYWQSAPNTPGYSRIARLPDTPSGTALLAYFTLVALNTPEVTR